MRVVLLNCIGIHTPEREGFHADDLEERHDEHSAEIHSDKLGFFDEGSKFMMFKGDHQKIFAYFKNFYIHRV
jgi:hypothetical protein